MTELAQDKMTTLREFMADAAGRQYSESYLIAVLHKAQELFGYLSREVMDEVANGLQVPAAHIWGVATFYHYFNLTPPGRYTISVCLGTACYVKGAGQILETLQQHLGIEVGEATADGLFSIQQARCVGACGLAPVMMIDDKIYGDLTPEKTVSIIEEHRRMAQKEM